MERHDPLSDISPTASPPEAVAVDPKPRKAGKVADRQGRKKLTPLLRSLADLQDDTIAFLYAGPEGNPADVAPRVAEIRQAFTTFCETNPHFPHWRNAWPAFMAERAVPSAPPEPQPPEPVLERVIVRVNFASTAVGPVPLQHPSWRSRLRNLAALYP